MGLAPVPPAASSSTQWCPLPVSATNCLCPRSAWVSCTFAVIIVFSSLSVGNAGCLRGMNAIGGNLLQRKCASYRCAKVKKVRREIERAVALLAKKDEKSLEKAL